MVRRRIIVLAVLLALATVGLVGRPASASGVGCTNVGDALVCVHVDAGADNVFGSIGLVFRTFASATVYLKQCHTDRTSCVTIATNNKPQTEQYISTSKKPAPLGHAFQACGSWTDDLGGKYINVCSEWRTNP